MSQNSTSVILTHGAWADGSSWAKVILPLEQHGLRVIAAPIPLTSLSNDVAALTRVIERTKRQRKHTTASSYATRDQASSPMCRLAASRRARLWS